MSADNALATKGDVVTASATVRPVYQPKDGESALFFQILTVLLKKGSVDLNNEEWNEVARRAKSASAVSVKVRLNCIKRTIAAFESDPSNSKAIADTTTLHKGKKSGKGEITPSEGSPTGRSGKKTVATEGANGSPGKITKPRGRPRNLTPSAPAIVFKEGAKET